MSNYWSDCGLVEFLDGRAYAIDSVGKTWDVGSEECVKETLQTGVIASNLCQDNRREALQIVIDYRRENGYGTETESFKPRGNVGNRDVRTFQPRKASIRQYQKNQTHTLRSFHKQV